MDARLPSPMAVRSLQTTGMISLQKLKVREGELVSASKYNAMLEAVEAALTLRDSPTVRVSRVGRGMFLETKSKAPANAYPFKLSVETTAAGVALRWTVGKVAGLEPEIRGIKLSSTKTADKRPPALDVPRAKLINGEAFVYFHLSLSRQWEPLKVELELHSQPPKAKAFEAYKLAATVQLSDSGQLEAIGWVQHNEDFWAALRTPDGKSHGFFYAV